MPDFSEPGAFVPAGKPHGKSLPERLENGGAGMGWRAEGSHRASRSGGCVADVDAGPGDNRKSLPAGCGSAFDQDAGEFGPVEQHVVRPFQPERVEPGRVKVPGHGIVGRKCRNEGKLRRHRRGNLQTEQEAGVNIALGGKPVAAAPAAPGGLHIRGNPERSLRSGG